MMLVASEAVPLAKSGGLGDVVSALLGALNERGVDARLVLPAYSWIDTSEAERLPHAMGVPMGDGERWCGILRTELNGGPVYLLEHDVYFDRPELYHDVHGEYGDNIQRFALLCRAAMQICHVEGFWPHVFHCHDWQAALLPVFLDIELDPALREAASVMTIHNLAYQGWFGQGDASAICLGDQHLGWLGFEARGLPNALSGGIARATMVSTVSPTYALEIQTPTYGEGLDGALRGRAGDLHGVLNGIDTEIWNPATDALLPAHFDADDLSGKAVCKAALQREVGLDVRPDVLLCGVVSRLAEQKGIDLIAGALDRMLDLDVQIVLLGTGDAWAGELFKEVAARRSDRFAAMITFSEQIAHRIEAASDVFLMPSRFEPCGLNQIYSQRYGTLPLVRGTGGLRDTVRNLDDREQGSGFVFFDASADALLGTLAWANRLYRDEPDVFDAARRRAMKLDRSWRQPAAHYEYLFRLAHARRQQRED